MDLTLESIRRHYRGAWSPLADVLARYRDLFVAFEDFRGYVDFWLLQDMVTDDYSTVRFFTPESRIASDRVSAMPQRPKPPDMIIMPSLRRPSSADLASGYTLFMKIRPDGGRC